MYAIDAETMETVKSLSLTDGEIAGSSAVRIDDSKEEQAINGEDALISAILTHNDVSIPSVGKLSFVAIAPDELSGGRRILYEMFALSQYESFKDKDKQRIAAVSDVEAQKKLVHTFLVVQNLAILGLEALAEENGEELSNNVGKKKDKNTKTGYAQLHNVETPGGPDEETPGNPDNNFNQSKEFNNNQNSLWCNFFDCFGSNDGAVIERIQLVNAGQKPISQKM